jgi:hypothetical protein
LAISNETERALAALARLELRDFVGVHVPLLGHRLHSPHPCHCWIIASVPEIGDARGWLESARSALPESGGDFSICIPVHNFRITVRSFVWMKHVGKTWTTYGRF